MIEFLIVASVVGAFAGAAGSIMVQTYREKRREYAALGVAEFERKLPPLPEAHAPEAPPPIQQQQPDAPRACDSRKDELLALIGQPKYRYLKRLLNPSAVLVKGPQGAGKSEFVVFLALLRALLAEHTIEVNDPHAHLNPWPDFLSVYGAGKNYAAISQRLKKFRARISAKYQPGFKVSRRHTSIWDEVTQYAEECDSDLAGSFLKSCLSDTRKIKEHPILISHSDTLTALGGSKGTHKMKEEGLISLHLGARSNPETGLPEPTFKGILKSLSESDEGKLVEEQIETAPWMRGSWLLSQFPELGGMALMLDDLEIEEGQAKSIPQLSPAPSRLTEQQSRLAFLFSLPTQEPQQEQPIPAHLKAILDYAKSQGGSVSVRQVQQRKLTELIAADMNKSESIQGLFNELCQCGLATVVGEGGGMLLALPTNE